MATIAYTIEPFELSDQILYERMASSLALRMPFIDRALAALARGGVKVHPFFDRLALDELITNAMLHGNQGVEAKRVEVRLFARNGVWGAEIVDEGDGFDWREQMEASRQSTDLYRESGRGIALLLALGAEVRYREPGNRVLLVRRPADAMRRE